MNNEIFAKNSEARSIRVFDESIKPTVEQLSYMVDCARIAPSAANMQPLKYKICADIETVKAIRPLTRWAGYLKDIKLPPNGKEPTAFIVICHDKSICPITPFSQMDVGIAAQSINLAAREAGFGICMIGSFEKESLKALLGFADECEPVLVIAVGAPSEYPIICSVGDDGSIKYFRDSADLHFVPKRSREDVLL